jgi:hypothetical protein
MDKSMESREQALNTLKDLRKEVQELLLLINEYEKDPTTYLKRECSKNLDACLKVLEKRQTK